MPPRPAKLHLRCTLPAARPPATSAVRMMSRGDIDDLGRLFYAAYLDTVDYEGESEQDAIATVAATFDGEFGPFVQEASTVLEREGRFVSASFITLWQGSPLLAFAVTRPGHKGQGLSRACTAAAMHALAQMGHTELHLFVTPTNAPALALYRRLGFEAADAA